MAVAAQTEVEAAVLVVVAAIAVEVDIDVHVSHCDVFVSICRKTFLGSFSRFEAPGKTRM